MSLGELRDREKKVESNESKGSIRTQEYFERLRERLIYQCGGCLAASILHRAREGRGGEGNGCERKVWMDLDQYVNHWI